MIHLVLLALSLFDGSSLAGWTAQGDSAWRVEEGAILASGSGDGFLVTDGEFGDFHLALEFWIDDSTNSGVFIRCQDRHRIHPDSCYELNIWDSHPRQEARTGAIVLRAMPPLAQVETAGKWNTLDVEARGRRVEVTVNGKLTARLEDAGLAAGFIALQHWEEGTVKFRNIVLTPQED